MLKDAREITHEIAGSLVEKEYEKFRIAQDKNYESDFDKEVKKLQSKKKTGKGGSADEQ